MCETLKTKMRSIKGQITNVTSIREVKTRKGTPIRIFKIVETRYRAGVDYDRREVVKDARANGDLPAVNAGLSGREWVEFPWFLTDTKTRTQSYFRFYPVEGTTPSVKYMDDSGVELELAVIKPYFLASELQVKTPMTCYDLKEDNIFKIGEVESEIKMRAI